MSDTASDTRSDGLPGLPLASGGATGGPTPAATVGSVARERPILFSAPMVRALLDGRKTQTRRVVKGIALDWLAPDMFTPEFVADRANGLCPYGNTGDRLWVRETWQSDVAHAFTKPSLIPAGERFFYEAGGEVNTTDLSVRAVGWRPSIHMPRWASRIALRVTDVRIERLTEISEPDAVAEGLTRDEDTQAWCGGDFGGVGKATRLYASPMRAYADLWEHINGPGSWDLNPWVWVVSFGVGDGSEAVHAPDGQVSPGMNSK